jgi:hypothetical protein
MRSWSFNGWPSMRALMTAVSRSSPAPPRRDHRLQIGGHAHLRFAALGRGAARGHFRQREQLLPVVEGQVGQAHEDGDRQLLGELAHELALAARLEAFDQPDRQLVRVAFQGRQALGRKVGVQDGPEWPVFGRIRFQRQQARWPGVSRHGHVTHRERIVVALDEVDVGRARRNPVAAVVGRPDESRAVAQSRPCAMQVVLPVPGPVDVEVHHQFRRNVGRARYRGQFGV